MAAIAVSRESRHRAIRRALLDNGVHSRLTAGQRRAVSALLLAERPWVVQHRDGPQAMSDRHKESDLVIQP